MGKKSFIIVKPDNNSGSPFFAILRYAFATRKQGDSFFTATYNKFAKEDVDGVISVLNVLKIYLVIIFFWSMFDQHGSSWVIKAKKMDLSFLGFNLQPEMLQAMNPIMVMFLIPICVFLIYSTFKLDPI